MRAIERKISPDRLNNTFRTIEMAEKSDLYEAAAVNAKKAGFPEVEASCRTMAYFAAEKAGRDYDLTSNTGSNHGFYQIEVGQTHVFRALSAIKDELENPKDNRKCSKLITNENPAAEKKLKDIYALAGIADPDEVREQMKPVSEDKIFGGSVYEFPTNLGITIREARSAPNESGWRFTTLLIRKTSTPQQTNHESAA